MVSQSIWGRRWANTASNAPGSTTEENRPFAWRRTLANHTTMAAPQVSNGGWAPGHTASTG
eukprot:10265018-Lingulodinium_polyedra.AAC.1